MTPATQKSLKLLKRGLLSIGAGLFILAMLLCITIAVALNYLNTGGGRDLIKSQLNKSLAASGYHIDFSTLLYDSGNGFHLENLDVSNKEGKILDLDRLTIGIAFSRIPARDMIVGIDGGTLNLYRLPESKKEAPPPSREPLKPFDTPNVFFNRITLDHLVFDKITLAPEIAGRGLTLSPRLKADISLADTISFDLALYPQAVLAPAEVKDGKKPPPDITLPEDILLAGSFTPSDLSLDLKTAKILSSDYALSASGHGKFWDDGALDFALGASYPDLKPLTSGNFERLRLSLGIKGRHDNPALIADGTLTAAKIKDRGLGDITLSSKASEEGAAIVNDFTLNTTFKDRPVALKTLFSYVAPRIDVTRLTATAPDIAVDGAGTFDLDASLFNGDLKVKADDLSAYRDLLNMPLSGRLSLAAKLAAIGGKQSATVNLAADDIRYDTLSLASAKIDAFLPDLAKPLPEEANADIKNLVVSSSLSLRTLTASMTGDDDAPGTYRAEIAANGTMGKPLSIDGKAALSNLAAGLPDISGLTLLAKLGQSSLTVSGDVNAEKVNLTAVAKDVRPADLPVTMPQGLRRIRIDLDSAMTGTLAEPKTKAAVAVRGLDAGKLKGLRLDLGLDHDGRTASLALNGSGPGIETLKADAALPLALSLRPFAFQMDKAAPLKGSFAARLDVGTIASLFLSPFQQFTGRLAADGTIKGTLQTPDVTGKATLSNGAFTDDQNGIELRAIAANATFTQDSVRLASLTATDGESGTMQGRGAVSFGDKSSTDLTLAARNFHAPKSELADGRFKADLRLKDTADGYAATGKITLQEMNVTVPESFQTKIPQLNIIDPKAKTDAPAKTIALDIDVVAENRIFVRGWGLDAEFGGDLDITGDAAAPLFDGTFSSKRGRYEEFGKRFTLSRANLRFQGAIPPSPYLDIEATTPTDDATASILLTGPVADPKITFSSTPALPEDEVLSRILFGRNTATITPFQAVQLAQTLQRFSGNGGGGFDPLGTLRSATGLDDISVGTDEDGDTNVGVGKYLTDDVYIEAERGKEENSGAAKVTIEVSPSINVESKIGQDNNTGGGIFWKRDY